MKKIDLTGQKFSRLTVIKEDFSKKRTAWLCKCDCGEETIITSDRLSGGITKSCGCLSREMASNRADKFWGARISHKMTGSRPYRIWSNMIQRCTNEKNKYYHTYGGNSITLIKDWRKFENFWKDMKHTYQDNLTIDRIDNNKGYSKNNCRWVNRSQQAWNTGKGLKTGLSSRFKGVTKRKRLNNWEARISKNYKTISLGYFKTEIEAAFVYDQVAMQLFGEFACTNFNYSNLMKGDI